MKPTFFIALLLIAAPAMAAKHKVAPKKRSAASEPTAKGAIKLKVVQLDLVKEQLTVVLANVSKPPAPNLYRLTDDRDRHYIAIDQSCAEPDANAERVCKLSLPGGYGRHVLKSVELHIGGLHGRLVAAPADEVKSAWSDAQSRMAMGMPAPPEAVDGIEPVKGAGLILPVGEF